MSSRQCKFGNPQPVSPSRFRWSSRGRTVVVVTVLLLATAMATVVVAPTAASAHGYKANGCTGVPDRGYGFDFHLACDGHDRCYHGQPFGTDAAGRLRCDRMFRSDMLDQCGDHGSRAKRVACRGIAWSYYYGVRVLGSPFWDRQVGSSIA